MYSYQTLKIFLSLLLMQEVDIEDDDDDDDSMDNETTEGDDQVNFFWKKFGLKIERKLSSFGLFLFQNILHNMHYMQAFSDGVANIIFILLTIDI